MKHYLKPPKAQIQRSQIEGWGVFATEKINADEIIEECHTLIFDEKPLGIEDYVFRFNDKTALPLGYGAIYNHHRQPNCRYYFDDDQQIMVLKATRTILPKEEIFIHYGQSWFKERNQGEKRPSKLRPLKNPPILATLGYSVFIVALFFVSE